MKSKLSFMFLVISLILGITAAKNCFSEPRRVLVEYSTGTWCVACPCGDSVAESILTQFPQTVFLAYHGPPNRSTEPFSYFNGNNIITLLGYVSYPTSIIDRTNSPFNFGYWLWSDRVSQRYTTSPESAIRINIPAIEYNPGTRTLTAIVNSVPLQTLAGHYKINFVITENNIVYYQSGNNCNPYGNQNYVHKWLVRNMVNSEFGEILNTNRIWNQNDSIPKNISTILLNLWVPENCNLVTFVYRDSLPFDYAEIQQSLLQPLSNLIGVKGNGEIAMEYSLSQNYPNPFNPTTNIHFSIAKSGNVSLKIYDLLGNCVAVYFDGSIKAGKYNAEVDASAWASGIYFYRLTAGKFTMTKKMILIK